MFKFKGDTGNEYLDQQPEIDTIVKEFINELEPTFPEAQNFGDLERLDCRSRDGFMPHSHNFGGWDKVWYTRKPMNQRSEKP